MREPLPESFGSISEAAAFWDSHDSAEYEDMMEDVDFEVNLKRRIFYVPVSENIFGAVREKARKQGLSPETLVNLLLQKHAG
jgi:predicted DNA binding CopG/RHH family protein